MIVVHHPTDRSSALAMGGFLHAGAPIHVPLDEGAIQDGETLLEAVERAASATAVVVLLSPNAVRNQGTGPDWEKFEIDVPLASVLLAPCVAPGVLRKHRWLDATRDRLQAFRSVKRWLFDPQRPHARPSPSDQLEALRARIADTVGELRLEPGSPLVRDFANAFGSEFAESVYLDCRWRSPENLLAELALTLGLRLEGPPDEHLREVRARLRDSRCLLALDNLDDMQLATDLSGQRCSILASEPSPAAPPDPLRVVAELRAWVRDPDAAIQLLPMAHAVFEYADWPISAEIGRLCFLLLRRQMRFAEAYCWVERLSEEAFRQSDRPVLVEAERERAWILEQWGGQADSPQELYDGPVQLSLFPTVAHDDLP